MLSEPLKETIRNAFEQLKKSSPSFKSRPAQNKMIAEVAKTLSGEYHQHQRLGCIEAPTGVGKTVAYLISAIPIAESLNKSLIIASANVALQEQLLFKDMPDIKRFSGLDFSYALAKGRSRYVCIRDLSNIAEYDEQSSLFDISAVWDKPPAQHQVEALTQMQRRYNNQQWDGDKDTLETIPDAALWQKIAANRHTCSAKRCDFYRDCCFFKARNEVSKADVIIANHDLVLADLSSGSSILPAIDDCIFIFDEAHHLADKALNHFALNASINTIDNITDNAIKLIKQIIKLTQRKDDISTTTKNIDALRDYKNDFTALINTLTYQQDIYQFSEGIVDKSIITIGKQMQNEGDAIAQKLSEYDGLLKTAGEQGKIDALLLESLQASFNLSISQLHHWLQTLNAFISPDITDTIPKCRWLVKTINDVQMNVGEIDVSTQLKNLIWQNCYGAILTSATLTALANFDRLKQKTGLSDMKHCQYIRLNSPFNYTQIPLNIANMRHQPDSVNFSEEVTEQLIKRLDVNEGTLVLFASKQQMQYVAQQVTDHLRCTLYMQGDFGKQTILDKYKKLRDEGKGCVIFGLDSFAEGVDLPGHYCTHLIIIKLRFNVPTSPLEKATYDYLQSQGINAFYHVSLPDASLRLIQACGRLIRTESDTGKISIFDRRLATKPYGKKLLAALPPYRIIIEQ